MCKKKKKHCADVELPDAQREEQKCVWSVTFVDYSATNHGPPEQREKPTAEVWAEE